MSPGKKTRMFEAYVSEAGRYIISVTIPCSLANDENWKLIGIRRKNSRRIMFVQRSSIFVRLTSTSTKPSLQSLVGQTKELTEKLSDYKAKLHLAEEDAIQATKRHSQQLENSAKYAIVPLAKDLLNIHDNLKRAIGCLTEEDKTHSTDIREILKALSHTENILTETFEEYGIEETDPLGHPFDPNFHEAMFEFPDPARKTGEIGHVINSGFTVHDRVLRAAKVGVVRNP
jgi:molecular chaperone GrpE